MIDLPLQIYTGKWRGGHIQGIAIDRERKYIYCSFTTEFVKLDMKGNLIGSVRGFTGHLGCMAYNNEDGRVYASLEYKNDVIGRSILNHLGITNEVKNAFYVPIFDVDKITRPNMNAETDGVMTTVWLREVAEDIAIDIPEIMGEFDAEDLQKNSEVFDAALEKYLSEYRKTGMEPMVYENADVFIAHYTNEPK